MGLGSDHNPYQPPDTISHLRRQTIAPKFSGMVISGLLVGLVTNMLAVLTFVPLLSIPPGGHLKPMIEAVFVGFLFLLSLCVGLPLSIRSVASARGRYRWLGIIACVLNLSVWPVGYLAMKFFVKIGGHYLEP